jgi:starch phosphorylase
MPRSIAIIKTGSSSFSAAEGDFVNDRRSIAYFSMEFALEPGMPLYSGGLGVLAGDTVRSAADLRVPMVGISILYRKGYFYQRIDDAGLQAEEPAEWIVEDYLTEMPVGTSVTIEGRTVRLRAWRYEVVGSGGYCIPVYFLDADMPDIAPEDRSLTHMLYGGDQHYRLCQEVILGIGGVRMLRSLGHDRIERFHMNEGHSSLLVLELLHEEMKGGQTEALDQEDIDRVRERCVFTTHTPVAAGFDKFSTDLVNRVIGSENIFSLRKDIFCCDDLLNMTYLALTMSHYVNGVAKKHGEQSRLMFAGYPIDAITNGVHAASWVCEPDDV